MVQLFQGPLPGEQAHMEFSPMRGKSSELLKLATNYKESAVAILIYLNEKEELCTLVTERQTYEGTHSGQISFPGGKMDPTDADLLETAIRECKEEIGATIERQHYLRTLTPVFIPVSNFRIEPKLFLLSTKPEELIPQEREVAKILELNLNQLFLPDSITHRPVKMQNNLTMPNIPHFSQNDVHVWGATALILNELKHLIKI